MINKEDAVLSRALASGIDLEAAVTLGAVDFSNDPIFKAVLDSVHSYYGAYKVVPTALNLASYLSTLNKYDESAKQRIVLRFQNCISIGRIGIEVTIPIMFRTIVVPILHFKQKQIAVFCFFKDI